jgi:hypothetical protein
MIQSFTGNMRKADMQLTTLGSLFQKTPIITPKKQTV